jgi:biopolymer transport protein ExbD
VLDMPGTSHDNPNGVPVVTKERVEQFTIKVEARQENGKPVIRVENEVVAPENLVAALRRYVRTPTRNEVLLDARGVDWGTVVAIQDAAKGAEINHVHFLVQPADAKANP